MIASPPQRLRLGDALARETGRLDLPLEERQRFPNRLLRSVRPSVEVFGHERLRCERRVVVIAGQRVMHCTRDRAEPRRGVFGNPARLVRNCVTSTSGWTPGLSVLKSLRIARSSIMIDVLLCSAELTVVLMLSVMGNHSLSIASMTQELSPWRATAPRAIAPASPTRNSGS